MPSSNKTLHLQLNKWLGSDKPKKDDFNNDNQKIDEACRLLAQSVELLESAVQSGSQTSEQALAALSSSFSAHSGNTGIHVTQSEKNAWTESSGAILGSYQGNGALTQKITLGFSPLFVMVFAVGDGLFRTSWTGQTFALNSGCVSKLGSSLGMTLNSDGFTVDFQSVAGFDGMQIKYNASGVKYVYIAFKQPA